MLSRQETVVDDIDLSAASSPRGGGSDTGQSRANIILVDDVSETQGQQGLESSACC